MNIVINIKTFEGNTATTAEVLRDLAACIQESSDNELDKRSGTFGWNSQIADSIEITVNK